MSINAIRKSRKSVAEAIISGAVAKLAGDDLVRTDSKIATGAVIALRQVLVEMERRGYSSKADFEACLDIIRLIERIDG